MHHISVIHSKLVVPRNNTQQFVIHWYITNFKYLSLNTFYILRVVLLTLFSSLLHFSESQTDGILSQQKETASKRLQFPEFLFPVEQYNSIQSPGID